MRLLLFIIGLKKSGAQRHVYISILAIADFTDVLIKIGFLIA